MDVKSYAASGRHVISTVGNREVNVYLKDIRFINRMMGKAILFESSTRLSLSAGQGIFEIVVGEI